MRDKAYIVFTEFRFPNYQIVESVHATKEQAEREVEKLHKQFRQSRFAWEEWSVQDER